MRDPYVESYEIIVDVRNGLATLNGTVKTYFEKAQVDDLASKTEGVIVVDDNIVVQESDAPYVINPYVDYGYTYDFNWPRYHRTYPYKTDTQIKQDIESEYFWSPFVDADQVNVAVEDGEATLTGTVDSYLEKGAARDNAYQGGAVFVDNDLVVSSY
jgi:osmotically-inducible protein OsmY